jgi:hypothetical protein
MQSSRSRKCVLRDCPNADSSTWKTEERVRRKVADESSRCFFHLVVCKRERELRSLNSKLCCPTGPLTTGCYPNLFFFPFSLCLRFVDPLSLLLQLQEVCELAGWGDEKLEFVKEKLTSEATQEDITKGKSPEQVRRRLPFLWTPRGRPSAHIVVH